ncbi:MAG TPA: sugar transferase [Candidatus Limnocylindria bacterium]|nr:sugar transferase [Candidatus Limnocylindria bacterium]
MRAEPCDSVPAWKRAEDLAAAVLLLAALLLPGLVVGAMIVVESGWPPLFRQRRIGLCGKEFLMWKFRSLPRSTPQVAKSDLGDVAARATALGRLLRRTSIDEFPQLLNVIVGDMSLVGPRPALFNQTELTEMRMRQGVLRVLPGLTGLAQVSGRENLTLDHKVELDALYVRTMSPAVDIGIAFRTIGAVMSGRGNR